MRDARCSRQRKVLKWENKDKKKKDLKDMCPAVLNMIVK
jgi:hypothetical protein